jgi:hypothetical protein
MSQTLITILVLGALVIIAAVAFVLYKAGFTVNTIKAKLPMVEVEASREKSILDKKATSPSGSKIRQRAEEGGVIKKSGITAPAGSAAEIDQQAKGEKSKIDDSSIKLT